MGRVTTAGIRVGRPASRPGVRMKKERGRRKGGAVTGRDKTPAGRPAAKRRDLLGGTLNGKDHSEVVAAVCRYMCEGKCVSEIAERIRRDFGIPLTRKDPYSYFRFAARHHWITFTPPYEFALRQQMGKAYGWLRDIDVVHTCVFDDVAARGAEMLVRMVQRLGRLKQEVHIGFAGGHAMRKLVQRFADLLRMRRDNMPETLVFHAMVAGFDVNDPSTDPNAFFVYLLKDPAFQVRTKFVLLRAPCLVATSDFEKIKSWQGVREAYDAARDIDIVCTSGSSWKDSHSALRHYMSNSSASLTALQKAGCVGDMLWRPLGVRKPIEVPTDIRAMTLMDLGDLPRHMREGKSVLLVLGPCNGCGVPKTDILRTILRTDPPLINHLVLDSVAARSIVKSD